MNKINNIDSQDIVRSQLQDFLSEKVIRHPKLDDTLDAIERVHKKSGREATGMLLLGLPGLGKTTILDKYVSDYLRRVETEELTTCPIIMLRMPAQPRIKDLIIKLIIASDNDPEKGTQTRLEHQLNKIIRDQKVELLIFDECQHLLREQAQANTRHVVNFIKTLMDEHKLSVIMAGTPNAANAILQHEELRQRLTYEEETLLPFNLSTDEDAEAFCTYLNTIRRILSDAGVNTIELTSIDMLPRFYLATKGTPRLINRLFDRAIMIADLSKKIAKRDFEQAYAKTRLNPELDLFNPFAAPANKVIEKMDSLSKKRKSK